MQIFCTALFFLLAVLFFAKYFSKHCCKQVQINSFTDKQRVKTDQPFSYSFEITNKKMLILPVIKIIFTLPASFAVKNGQNIIQSEKTDQSTYIYTVTTSLLSYQKVKKKIRFIPLKRGCYTLQVSVRLLDFIGLKNIPLLENQKTVILVHPKGNRETASFIDADSTQGNQITVRWILQDPIFYSGIREYDPRDSMKDIEWKASAKSNRLLAKKYDASSDTEICTFIFTEYKDRFNKDYDAFLENTLEIIASLIKEAYQNQIPMGLATNLAMKNKMPDSCEIRFGASQTIQLLDFLSCISDYAKTSPQAYMKSNFNLFKKKNCLFILFFYNISEESAQMINYLAKEGYKIKIFSLNFCQSMLHRSVEFYKIKNEEVNL